MTTNLTNAEDSICPRGWKIPSRAGGDSWENLVNTAYKIPNYGNNVYSVNQIKNWPLSFMPTGAMITVEDMFSGMSVGVNGGALLAVALCLM